MVNNWLNFALSSLFPYRCVLCKQPSELERDLCLTCEQLQTLTPATHCAICAIPLEPLGETNDKIDSRICGECLHRRPAYDRAFIPYIYSNGIRRMISQLKFRNKLIHAGILAELFNQAGQNQQLQAPEAIVPMPLHVRRLRQRGYNQSLLLANAIAGELDIRLETGLCRRVKHTPPQMELSRKQRRKNIKGVFEIISEVAYRHIAIVDDVMTTGSSANELAKMFKQAGVKRVDVWCIARTVKD